MSASVALKFFPATFGLVQSYRPLWDALFPEWVQEMCPVPFLDFTLPWGSSISVKWPTVALTMVFGMFMGWATGLHLLSLSMTKIPGRGLFVWGFAFLWYGVMCLGGLFFHSFDIRTIFHSADVVATGNSSMSILMGFATLASIFDDRPVAQRSTLLIGYLALAATAILGPSLLKEQLYLVPMLASAGVGTYVLSRCWHEACNPRRGATQQASFKTARLWILLASIGFVVAAGAVLADRWLCMYLGSNAGTLFWIFLGCNFSIWCLYRFVLVVNDAKLQFSELKRQ